MVVDIDRGTFLEEIRLSSVSLSPTRTLSLSNFRAFFERSKSPKNQHKNHAVTCANLMSCTIVLKKRFLIKKTL